MRRVSETSSSAERVGSGMKKNSLRRAFPLLSREHQALVGHEASSSLDLIRVADQNRLLTWQTRFECVKIEDLIGRAGRGSSSPHARSDRRERVEFQPIMGPHLPIFPCSAESALRFSAPEFDDDLIFESNSHRGRSGNSTFRGAYGQTV